MRALFAAAVSGFVGVALGAFGAHGLKGWLDTLPDGAQRLAWWHTGVEYQMTHALLLVGVGVWGVRGDTQPPSLRWAVGLLMGGTVLFSGSLYAMTLTGMRALGAVTPFGGLCFLAAWACVGVAAWRQTTISLPRG